MSDQSIVEVTQADRDAAAALMVALFTGLPDLENDLRWSGPVKNGEDDTYPFVQAFARHRIAEREACAKVVDAFEAEENSVAYEKRQAGRDDSFNCARASAANRLAAAIRARSDRVDDMSYAGAG
jgi:hypothetical protein